MARTRAKTPECGDTQHGGSFGKTKLGQGEARDLEDDDHETQQRHEPSDSTTEEKHFVLEPDCVQFEDVQCHYLGACPGQPSTGRGLGNAMPDAEIDVAR